MESEEQLLPLLWKDDLEVFRKLIRRHLELANSAAMKLTGEQYKAIALANAAFTLIWFEREKIPESVSFRVQVIRTIYRLHRIGYPYLFS